MQKALRILRWILSAATAGILLLLCWHCLDIFITGNLPENITNGVYLTPVYTAQIVAEKLSGVKPLLILYIIFATVTVIAHMLWGEKQRATRKVSPCPPRAENAKFQTVARITVLCLGVLFIILGTMNGGARDVLVKAINICTECIGLG